MGIVEKKYIDKKIVTKLRILAIMELVLLGILITHMVQSPGLILATVLTIIAGFFVGKYIVLRITAFDWDEKTLKVVTKVDRIGKIILGFYFVFALSRKWIFGQYFQGSALTQVILASAAGVILGRIFGTRTQIKKVFYGIHKNDKPADKGM
jgi:hypothetical protein